MPIYEYICDDCGHELEALQGISDETLTDCPACDHSALRRKISAAAFRLKGSGWYETDFKKDNRRNLAGEGKKEGAKTNAGSAEGGQSSSTPSKEKPTASSSDNKPSKASKNQS
ncbi:MAG: zinc ribbon domain-containing protein [Spiribacter sp.]|jgi:putative FmdB family regulatory protein|nr:zinc ribbon domain-containing protein [Spiribacter sp.]MDR9490132.1 zinc ribbon domain-containing protein [Spiribacter sp.]